MGSDEGAGRTEWQEQIRGIARGWLFSDVPAEKFPKSVILPLENPDLHDESSFVSKLSGLDQYRTISIGKYGDGTVGVLKSKFGAPATAMTIDVLAAAGVSSVVGVGYCGSLCEQVGCGDLVLPIACVRDDGTSARYVDPGFPAAADFESLHLLTHLASAKDLPWHSGVVWSTDAILRETSALVNHWAKHGVIGVDMEAGALFTIARLLGLRAVSILVASDNPFLGVETDGGKLSTGMRAAIDLALEFAARVSLTA